jgi:hypothetical protein
MLAIADGAATIGRASIGRLDELNLADSFINSPGGGRTWAPGAADAD